MVVQTMLLRGDYGGHHIDNTTPTEVAAYLEAIRQIHPSEVMLYTIDRNTPADNLQKISYEEMEAVAEQIRGLGLDITVSVAR